MQTLFMNRMSTFIRLALAGLAFVAALAVLSSPGSAQETAPDPVQAEKVQRFLELVDDPQVRSWLLSAKPATGAAAPATVANEPVSYAGFASIFRARAAQLLGGLRAFPAETARAASVLQSELDTSRSARPIVFVLAFIAAGLAAQWCFWWLSRGWRAWIASLRFLTVRDKLVAISARLLWGTSYVLAFALGSLGFFLAFDWSPLVREIVVGYLFAVVIFRLALVAFDFLLAPSGSDGFANAERFRVIPVSDQAAAHWTKRLGYLVGWYAFGSVTVHLLTTLGFADPSRQVVAYTLGIVLLLLGIEAVWNRPMVHRPTEHASRFSRIGVRARNWVWTGYFVALWLLWVAGAMKPFWIAVVAAALPGAIALTRASVDNLLKSSLADAEGPTRPGVISVMVERGIRAAHRRCNCRFGGGAWSRIDRDYRTGFGCIEADARSVERRHHTACNRPCLEHR